MKNPKIIQSTAITILPPVQESNIVNEYYLYNQSLKFQMVKLFSDHIKHTGRIDSISSSDNPKLAKFYHRNFKSGYLDKININTSNFPAFHPITIIEDEKSITLMPIYYFSVYQSQTNMFSIPVAHKVRNFNIIYPLKHNDNVSMKFIWVKDSNVKFIKDESTIDIKNTTLTGDSNVVKIKKLGYVTPASFGLKQLAFIVNNTTRNTVKVDLIGLLFGKKYHGVEFEAPIKDFTKNNKFNMLKIVSYNTSQVCKAMQFKKSGKETMDIFVSFFVSAYQQHLWVNEVNRPFEFTKKDSIFIDILPETKVMYYFYDYEVKK